MKVTVNTGKNIITFGEISIVQSMQGEAGYDPLNQREALGVKCRIGDEYYGYWFETNDMTPAQAIYALGQSLMDLAVDPMHFNLAQSFTPDGLNIPIDWDRISPLWDEEEEAEEEDEISVAR